MGRIVTDGVVRQLEKPVAGWSAEFVDIRENIKNRIRQGTSTDGDLRGQLAPQPVRCLRGPLASVLHGCVLVPCSVATMHIREGQNRWTREQTGKGPIKAGKQIRLATLDCTLKMLK